MSFLWDSLKETRNSSKIYPLDFVYSEALFDFEGRLENRCSWKFHKNQSKTLEMESLLACNVNKKWLQHRCFSVSFAKFSRTSII